MSWKAMDWAFEQECRDGLSKLVLITIAKHADNNSQAFPSVSRIAKLSCMSSRTVHRKLSELQEDGFIEVKNRGNDGKKTSNLYRLVYTTHSQGVVTDSHIGSDTVSDRIDKTNKSSNIVSSINGTDSHNKKDDVIDWAALAAEGMKGKRNGKPDNTKDDL